MTRLGTTVLLALALCALVGCSSEPGIPHVTAVSGAHVRGQWEAELSPSRPARLAAPHGQVLALTKEALRVRAQLVAVRFYRARSGRAAPAVVLAVSDPAKFLKHRLRRFLGRLHTVNGLYGDDYVGVVDSEGQFVWENGRAHLPGTFAGTLWIRPDLDSCSPVQHGHLALRPPPPPCPAD
jgi:hypothetical protein